MSQIRIKLDLPFEYALRLAAAMADDAHEYQKMVRFYDEKEKPEYSKFYVMLANQARIIKDALDLQLKDAKNIYIGEDEDESARA